MINAVVEKKTKKNSSSANGCSKNPKVEIEFCFKKVLLPHGRIQQTIATPMLFLVKSKS